MKKRKYTPYPDRNPKVRQWYRDGIEEGRRRYRLKMGVVNLIDQDLEAAIHIQSAEEIIRMGS